MSLFGSVEAGGTTFVCAVGSGPHDLAERTEIPTADPQDTLARVIDQLARHRGRLKGIGIASFGPIDIAAGRITSTPKPGWAGTPIVEILRDALGGLPVGFDTDVNGAAFAEGRWGAARGLDTFTYVTIGTGVGGGGLVGGRAMHGLVHPEMGHMRVPRHPADPLERGSCPYHPDCWEGWASRDAIEKRWGEGCQATDLTGDGQLELLAHYVAAGLANIIFAISPQRIVLGGGVILGGGRSQHRDLLLTLVRAETLRLLGGYVQAAAITERMEDYIVPPALGADAGVLGGIVLAQSAADAAQPSGASGS
jgi:fructokinase